MLSRQEQVDEIKLILLGRGKDQAYVDERESQMSSWDDDRTKATLISLRAIEFNHDPRYAMQINDDRIQENLTEEE